MKVFRDSLRSLVYWLGLLGLVHRVRNRRTLTVLMFHRVLPPDSVEYLNAEREFTFSVPGFGRCLDFVMRHYKVVTLADLDRARSGIKPLPNNAALITFDDGWRDTVLHAQPELKRRNLQALLFVATELPDLKEERWWQDALVSALADSASRAKLIEHLQSLSQPKTDATSLSNAQINAMLAGMPEPNRMQILSKVCSLIEMPRQMLNSDELAQVQGDTFSLGAHGYSHAPLTAVMRPEDELKASCHWLKACDSKSLSMSFPHGSYDQNLVHLASATGFQWIFTSDPVLVPTDANMNNVTTLGRIHIPENQWTCNGDKVSYPLLATFLFFRPNATVQ